MAPSNEARSRGESVNESVCDSPGFSSLVFAKDGSLQDRGLVKPDNNNFAPRVGAVYRLDDNTVLRGPKVLPLRRG